MRQVNPGQRQRGRPCVPRIAVIAAILAIPAAVIAATVGLVLLPLSLFI